MNPPDETLHDPDSAPGGERSARETPVYQPGEQIAARYEVLALLGRGASGAVYHVLDHTIGEEIAVKIIDDEVRTVLAPILDGLEAAHDAGVIHRDLKPANVLIAGDGRILLSDFGVAERVGSTGRAGDPSRGGTPAYMAPEQLTGGAVDGRTDLYAVGIIAYQLLSGTMPFVAAGQPTTLATARERVSRELPALEDTTLAAAVAALTARKPDRRPAGMAQARALLGIDAATAPAVRGRGTWVLADVRKARVSSAGDVLSLPWAPGVGQTARIQITSAATGETRVVGPESTEITYADWSPDGRRIAYSQRDETKDDRGSLWLLDLARNESRLIADGVPTWNGLAWVDDGTIAFFRGEGEQRALYTVEVATGEEANLAHRLGFASLPSIAPDGRLLYVTDRMEYGIWVYELEGRLQRVTSLGSGHAKSPSWVTTRDELLYLVQLPGEGYEVRRVRADTYSEITARRTIGGDNPYVAMSPDGRYVAYGESREDRSVLLLADIETDAEPLVLDVAYATAALFPIEFSVHGTRVTYILEDIDGTSEIWDVDLEADDNRLLVEDAGSGIRSRDGSWICYQLQLGIAADGGLHVQRTGPDGRPVGERFLVPETQAVKMVRFGPGAHEITAMDERELFVVDFTTGARRPLADLPRGTYFRDRMSVHPDGRVAAMLGVGSRTIIAVDNFAELRAAAQQGP